MDARRVVKLVGVGRLTELCGVDRSDVREWVRQDWIPPLHADHIHRATGAWFAPRRGRERGYPGAPNTFFAYVRPDVGNACWGWAGFIDRDGTARHYFGGRLYRAQRLAIEMVTGRPVPSDRVVVTSCGGRSCVNPEHLWAVPRGEAARARYGITG